MSISMSLPILLPTDTPAEILANSAGNTRARDAATVAARRRYAAMFDTLFRAVKEAALAGNVTCKNALAEILLLK